MLKTLKPKMPYNATEALRPGQSGGFPLRAAIKAINEAFRASWSLLFSAMVPRETPFWEKGVTRG